MNCSIGFGGRCKQRSPVLGMSRRHDISRTVYKITSSSPGTEAAVDACAALASTAIVFRKVDSIYYTILLRKRNLSLTWQTSTEILILVLAPFTALTLVSGSKK